MTFEQWWATMEAKGYRYGADALEGVQLGFEAAMALKAEANVLDHLDGQWQKLATMILWKLNGDQPFTLTAELVKEFGAAHAAKGGAILVTIGKADDVIEYRVMNQVDAELLVMKRQDRNIKRREL